MDVSNFPGATSSDVLTKIDDVLNKKPIFLNVHVGANDLINDINLLSNIKQRLLIKLTRYLPIRFWLFQV